MVRDLDQPFAARHPGWRDIFATGFAKLVLPKLQHLDIGLRERRIHNVPHWANPSVNAKLLPDLNVLAQSLRRLVLSDVSLSFERINDLVASISDGGHRGGLESIDLVVKTLSPHIFDLFSAEVPWLKMLTVEYLALSDAKEKVGYYDSHVSPWACRALFF